MTPKITGNTVRFNKHTQITPTSVAHALNLFDAGDDYDATGEYIAADLIAGRIPLTNTEMSKIAAYFGLTENKLVSILRTMLFT